MSRLALLVGIDAYEQIEPQLAWCADDAVAMREVLAFHGNYDPNFACHMLLARHPAEDAVASRVTFNDLRTALEDLFAHEGMAVFYYSGHGIVADGRTYLATSDGNPGIPGLALSKLLEMANHATAHDVLLILDACYAGALGEAEAEAGDDTQRLYLRPGITLLAAARPRQHAIELDGHGMFTRLALDALKGGAADVRGRVSAAAIYSYVEQALGPWDQRPIYKSNATRLDTIRYCQPDVEDAELRRLPRLFPTPDYRYPLDPSYEVTVPQSSPRNIATFKLFKRYEGARLLRPTRDTALYFAALRGHTVELTPLGQFYWQLAQANLLGESRAFTYEGRSHMPDAEVVARLFHEAYERLAPAFGYVTREETRVPWEQVPDHSRRLMIATAAEVLAEIFSPDESSAQSAEHAGDQVATTVERMDERALD